MNDREEFKKWLADYVNQEPKNFDRFMYKLMTVKEAWQEATTRQQSKIDQLEKDKQEAIEMLIKWHSIVFAKPYNSNEIMECDHVQLIEKLTGKSIEELLK